MRRYIVKRLKAKSWQLSAKHADGSESPLGDYRSRGAAFNVGRLLAGATGTVEDAPKEEKPHAP